MATAQGIQEKNDRAIDQRSYQFKIEPISGREALQACFVSLPMKARSYNNRHITLNERFSVVERGYRLVPLLTDAKTDLGNKIFLEYKTNYENGIRDLLKENIDPKKICSLTPIS